VCIVKFIKVSKNTFLNCDKIINILLSIKLELKNKMSIKIIIYNLWFQNKIRVLMKNHVYNFQKLDTKIQFL